MSEDEEFRRAMALAGVKKLAERPDRVPRERRPGRVRLAAQRQPSGLFEIDRSGDRVEGLAAGAARHHLDQLFAADLSIEVTLDLHGHSEEAARRVVEEAVERAHAAGQRCLRVIHGRGRRSPGAPVLKEALPDWLTGPRCAARVLAFTSAPIFLGGSGATLVLLRRRR